MYDVVKKHADSICLFTSSIGMIIIYLYELTFYKTTIGYIEDFNYIKEDNKYYYFKQLPNVFYNINGNDYVNRGINIYPNNNEHNPFKYLKKIIYKKLNIETNESYSKIRKDNVKEDRSIVVYYDKKFPWSSYLYYENNNYLFSLILIILGSYAVYNHWNNNKTRVCKYMIYFITALTLK